MIAVKNINKSYGNLHVLKNVSLNVAKGEVVVIIGPSGSGKSTLLRCMNYLEQIQEGSIEIEGKPIGLINKGGKLVEMPQKQLDQIRSEVGMVFQNFNHLHKSMRQRLFEIGSLKKVFFQKLM